MKKQQTIKVYFTLGEEAYNVIKRWQDEKLQEKLIELFSSSYFKNLSNNRKEYIYKMLSIVATRDDNQEQSEILNNVYELIMDENLKNSLFFRQYLNLIADNPNLNVAKAYDLEANPDMDAADIYEVICCAANGVSQRSLFEGKKWGKWFSETKYIFKEDSFNRLPLAKQEEVYKKLEEIRTSKALTDSEKYNLLLKFWRFFSKCPLGIEDAKFDSYFMMFLRYPQFGDLLWNVMHIADDQGKSKDDIEKWLNICADLNAKYNVDPYTFYFIVLNNKLMAYGILDVIINNILNSKLSKNVLVGDISNLLNNLDFNIAINVVLALFKMPSQKYYDLVSSLIRCDEVLHSNGLIAFIDRVIATPEDKLDELRKDIEYEVIYHEMPFSKAAIEHNSEAMDYLDSHPGIKSTSLVRIPIWQKRDKYKI